MSNVLNSDHLTPSEQERVERRQRVIELHTEGATPREIAEKLGVSTQRIYEQLKQLRGLGLIEEEAS